MDDGYEARWLVANGWGRSECRLEPGAVITGVVWTHPDLAHAPVPQSVALRRAMEADVARATVPPGDPDPRDLTFNMTEEG